MRKLAIILAVVATVAAAAALVVFHSPRFPELRGPYLGQRPPGTSPELFAPGIVSSRYPATVPVFSPDGNTVYWSRIVGRGRGKIVFSTVENGVWSRPRAMSFSGGDELDARPVLTGDGHAMMFVSRRAVGGQRPAPMCFRLWMAARAADGWTLPRPLDPPVNTGFEDFSALAGDGTLYITSWRPDGPGKSRASVYSCRFSDGRYEQPELLPPAVNGSTGALAAYVAPDESYLIVERFERDGPTDLFISFRRADGSWAEAVSMGGEVNSPAYEHFASVSPDGRYLFFASDRAGGLDVYWMDAGIIEILRAQGSA